MNYVNDTTKSVFKQHLSNNRHPPMCLSNAPAVREFIANAEAQPATLLPFVVQQQQHLWIQPQPEAEVTMGNNDDISDDQTSSTDDTSDDEGSEEEEDGFQGNIINWDEDDGLLSSDELMRRLNVYRGYERPRNDEDWRIIFEYMSSCSFLNTGQEYEFREWQEDQVPQFREWCDDDEDDDDDDDDID